MAIKTRKWDASEFLDSDEMIAAYIDVALEDGDPTLITAAIGDVARAKGMTAIARDAGVSRESLYKALTAEGNPEFATIVKVLKALQLRLTVRPGSDKDNPQAA